MRVEDEPQHAALRRANGRGDDALPDIADRRVLDGSGSDRSLDCSSNVMHSPVGQRSVGWVGVREQPQLATTDGVADVERLIKVALRS